LAQIPLAEVTVPQLVQNHSTGLKLYKLHLTFKISCQQLDVNDRPCFRQYPWLLRVVCLFSSLRLRQYGVVTFKLAGKE